MEKNLDSFILDFIETRYGLSRKDINAIIRNQNSDVTIHIFCNKNLGPLETLVKFLHENMQLAFNEIAQMLQRNPKTIWSTYNNSIKKHKNKLDFESDGFYIPLKIFSNRKYSVLENLVRFFKDKGFEFKMISRILNRSESTIRTCYMRALAK